MSHEVFEKSDPTVPIPTRFSEGRTGCSRRREHWAGTVLRNCCFVTFISRNSGKRRFCRPCLGGGTGTVVLARQPSCPARRPEDEARQGSARRPAEVLQAAEERAPLALAPQRPMGGWRRLQTPCQQSRRGRSRRGPFGQSHSRQGARDGRGGRGSPHPRVASRRASHSGRPPRPVW